MTEPDFAATREQVKRDVLRAFGVKAWQIGLAPRPWWVTPWYRIRRPFDRVRLYRKGVRWRDGRWVDTSC